MRKVDLKRLMKLIKGLFQEIKMSLIMQKEPLKLGESQRVPNGIRCKKQDPKILKRDLHLTFQTSV